MTAMIDVGLYAEVRRERDEARADLKREQDAAFAMSADLEVERMATNEARAIARRLADVVRAWETAAGLRTSTSRATAASEALDAFDALPWAKDDA